MLIVSKHAFYKLTNLQKQVEHITFSGYHGLYNYVMMNKLEKKGIF